MPTSTPNPRRKRTVNLWPRRIITGTGLLAVIALLVWGIWAGISALLAQASTVQSAPVVQAGDEVTADGIVSGENTLRIPTCDESGLTVTPTVASTQVGKGVTVEVNLHNPGQTVCSTSAGRYAIVVGSGEDVYFDGRVCEGRDVNAIPLLLSPTMSWGTSLRWEGARYNGCTLSSSDAAPAGAYWVQLYTGDEPLGERLPFAVEAVPTPAPETTSTDATAEQSAEGSAEGTDGTQTPTTETTQ